MVTRLLLALVATGCLSTPARPTSADATADMNAPTMDVPTFTMRHWEKPAYSLAGPEVLAPSLAYDGDRHEVLLYGGETTSGDATSDAMYRLTPSGWTLVCDPCMPGPRAAASFAWDPFRHVVVLVGGYTIAGTYADAFFYEWDGVNWTKKTTQLPAPRAGSSLVFDPTRSKLILIGGVDAAGDRNDAYAYNGLSLDPLPSATGHTLNNGHVTAAHDTLNGRVVAVPGNGNGTATGSDDVIALGSTATTWTGVCTNCGAYRRLPAVVFDPVLHQFLMIGGLDMNDTKPSGTWALVGNQWMQISGMPPGRSFAAAVYDKSRETIVLYGGNSVPNCPGGNGNCNETWEMKPN